MSFKLVFNLIGICLVFICFYIKYKGKKKKFILIFDNKLILCYKTIYVEMVEVVMVSYYKILDLSFVNIEVDVRRVFFYYI